MLGFSTLLLRSYYGAIGFNEDNLYSNLTRSSSGGSLTASRRHSLAHAQPIIATAILDFAVPSSAIFQISKSPTDVLYSSYALDALPQLNGSVSYVTCSRPLPAISGSATIPLKTMIDHFRIWPVPVRPPAADEEYLAGERVVPPRDYLLYSRLHLPTLHLSGLATTRLSPTLQAHVAFVHQPALVVRPSQAQSGAQGQAGSQNGGPSQPLPSPTTPSAPAVRTPGNLLLSLQQDTGRWSAEYSYSAEDGMVGLRGLYNFGMGRLAAEVEPGLSGPAAVPVIDGEDGKRVDEEEAMEGGLRGRFSAGAELYFSKKQRSLGVSTGLRFTTLPPATSTVIPTSPPTTLTILYNPIIGYLSTAYSAQISPHVALSSRYGLNVYSYESELAVGGEWWIGSGRGIGGWRGLREADGTEGSGGDGQAQVHRGEAGQRDGVLKGKISGSGIVSMVYESRIRQCLVSVGVVSDLGSRARPIRGLGLEVQYLS